MKLETTTTPNEPTAKVDTNTAATAAMPQPTEAELRDFAQRVERVREDERMMLARELHDDVGGTLAAIKMIVQRLRKHAGNAPIKSELDEMSSLTDSASRAIQDVIRTLRPGLLDQGLVAALEWEAREFQRRTGVVCNFHSNRPTLDIPKGQGVALYRIGQEALTNIAKHAEAAVVEIVLHRDGDGITLEVTDNGAGFDVAQPASPNSFGLMGMRERLRAYGGWVEVNSTQGLGTTVMVGIPLRRAQDTRP